MSRPFEYKNPINVHQPHMKTVILLDLAKNIKNANIRPDIIYQ